MPTAAPTENAYIITGPTSGIRADQVGVGEASAKFCESLAVPFYHLSRDAAQATRMRPWFSHPKSKVDLWSNAGHWIMQDSKDDVSAAVTNWIDAL